MSKEIRRFKEGIWEPEKKEKARTGGTFKRDPIDRGGDVKREGTGKKRRSYRNRDRRIGAHSEGESAERPVENKVTKKIAKRLLGKGSSRMEECT